MGIGGFMNGMGGGYSGGSSGISGCWRGVCMLDSRVSLTSLFCLLEANRFLGHRRNIHRLCMFLFILLAQIFGITVAQNLFYICLLFRPISRVQRPGESPRSNVLRSSFAVSVYTYTHIAFLVLAMISSDITPYLPNDTRVTQSWTLAHLLLPQFFALGIQVSPKKIIYLSSYH